MFQLVRISISVFRSRTKVCPQHLSDSRHTGNVDLPEEQVEEFKVLLSKLLDTIQWIQLFAARPQPAQAAAEVGAGQRLAVPDP